MGDFPRFLVLFGIIVGRLDLGQGSQRANGELGKGADAFHRDDERVAAKEGHEPGDAGRGNERAAPDGRVHHPQRFGILDRLSPDRG